MVRNIISKHFSEKTLIFLWVKVYLKHFLLIDYSDHKFKWEDSGICLNLRNEKAWKSGYERKIL